MIPVEEATQTKSGIPVRIYATDAGGPCPIHGAIWSKDTGVFFIRAWTSDGVDCVSRNENLDLRRNGDLNLCHDWKDNIP